MAVDSPYSLPATHGCNEYSASTLAKPARACEPALVCSRVSRPLPSWQDCAEAANAFSMESRPKTGTLTVSETAQNYGNASFYWYYGSSNRTRTQWEGGVSSEEE